MRGTKLLGFKREKASECTLTVSLNNSKNQLMLAFSFIYSSRVMIGNNNNLDRKRKNLL